MRTFLLVERAFPSGEGDEDCDRASRLQSTWALIHFNLTLTHRRTPRHLAVGSTASSSPLLVSLWLFTCALIWVSAQHKANMTNQSTISPAKRQRRYTVSRLLELAPQIRPAHFDLSKFTYDAARGESRKSDSICSVLT